MSRVGKKPVKIPSGCTVTISGNTITVKGSKGELAYEFPTNFVTVTQEGDEVIVKVTSAEDADKYHGLVRTLIANMVLGTTEGFERKLEVHGVGYKAQVQGTKLVLSLGFSHPVEVQAPQGIQFEMEKDAKNVIIIKGFDKQLVGEVAAKIREYRQPEPYKGKGIRYQGEHIIRKAGKSASK